MRIQLSDHFNFGRLIRFTVPSIAMMIFTSIYGIVDGIFVSNFVGKTPFAALNFIMPFLMMLGSLGFMFGTGGSALVAKIMGEGNKTRAKGLFTMITIVAAIIGLVMAVAAYILLPDVARLMGAKEMLPDCVLYGRIILLALPFLVIQFTFQTFYITAEKPKLGLVVTVMAGVTNMVLDALFIIVFKWGLAGAAAATAVSQAVGGIFPLIYFSKPRGSLIYFTKPVFEFKALLKTCTNGSSELVSNLSMSLVGMIYNIQLMKYAGQNGVAAYGVIMYVTLLFLSIFIGYSVGVSPVISYHFGACNSGELKGLFRKSLILIGLSSLCMLILSETLAYPISAIFVSYDAELLALTARSFRIYAFMYLFAGIGIFGSAFFTALNDGLISALISFLRTLVFQVAAVMTFPLIFGIDGIWLSIVIADFLASIITVCFLAVKRKKYQY